MPRPGFLGREERLEQPVAHFGGHAETGIADDQLDVRARNHVEVVLAEFDVRRLDRQRAAVGHRVARVDDEVHHHLADLLAVGADRREVGLQRKLQADLGSEQAADQVLHVRDHVVEVDRLGDRDLAPAEGEQLLGQPRGAIGGAAHFDRRGMQRRIRRRLLDQLVAVAKQHGNQVVEVVRDAGGEPADRFHLLRLAQLVLETIALAQVARDRRDADHLAVADQHPRLDVDRHARALARHELGAEGARRAVGALIDHLGDRVEVVGAEDPVGIEHPQLFAQVAGGLLAAAIDGRQPAAPIVHDHDLAGAIEQVVETRLERDFTRQLAADGLFAREAAAKQRRRDADGYDGNRGDEPDPPGSVTQFGQEHNERGGREAGCIMKPQ